MNKTIFALAASALLAGALSSPVFADDHGKGQTTRSEHQSDCGSTHGAFADENGNFGFLGQEGGTPGYHDGARGQDQGATGYNNSHTDCQSSSS